MAPALHFGITAALAAMAACSLTVALFSPFRNSIAGPDGNSAAVLAAMAGATAAYLGARGASFDTILVTVLCGLSVTTIVTAIVLFVLGEIRAARLIRYIPFPVMAGFIGAAGCLLVAGSIRVSTGITPDVAHAHLLLAPGAAVQCVLTVAIAFLMLFAQRRISRALGMMAVLTGATVIIDILVLRTPAASSWFVTLHGPRSAAPWFAALPARAIDWSAIAHSTPAIATVVLVSTITILFNAKAFELRSNVDVDLDRELRADGIGNALSAVAGGFVGYFSLNRTSMNALLGADSRASGILVGVIGAALLLSGTSIIAFVPKVVLGGLLLYLGVNQLGVWVYRHRTRIAPLEFAALLSIVAVILWLGFLYGIGVGLVTATALFAFNYGRIPVIAQRRSGITMRSTLMRSPAEATVLGSQGDAIRILVLDGFLFYGVSDRLYRDIRAECTAPGVQFVILHFGRVSGVDSAAIEVLINLGRAARRDGVHVIFAAMSDRVAMQWVAAAADVFDDIEHFGDVDYALEWCENALIESSSVRTGGDPLRTWLASALENEAYADGLCETLTFMDLERGAVLCAEDDPADAMFFIEAGRIGIFANNAKGERYRLRSLSANTVMGEMGLYRGTPRSATAVAETASQVWFISRDDMHRLQREQPEVAMAVHTMVVRELSNRLADENREFSLLR